MHQDHRVLSKRIAIGSDDYNSNKYIILERYPATHIALMIMYGGHHRMIKALTVPTYLFNLFLIIKL
jgi:hypothetical protein